VETGIVSLRITDPKLSDSMWEDAQQRVQAGRNKTSVTPGKMVKRTTKRQGNEALPF